MPSLNNRRWRFHGLKKPKVRQDWNKYNLYNLSRLAAPNAFSRTYFQQKWTAKATTRAYHGEVMREKQWERMFSRTTNAVVPMDPRYLAQNDGSEHAAGRGSGLEQAPNGKDERSAKATPYMQMVYHPIERRLDSAIFRALFASSTRQARQFVVHGQVKVNGKKMIYPGYLLNPGDMFQVEPERVLFGTGAWKGSSEPDETYFETLPFHERGAARDVFAGRKPGSSKRNFPYRPTEGMDPETVAAEEEALEADPADEEALEEIPPEDPLVVTKRQIQSLRFRTQTLVTKPPSGVKVSNTRKQELRAFHKTLKTHLSRAQSVTPSMLDDLETQLADITTRILASQQPTEPKPVPPPGQASEPTVPTPAAEPQPVPTLPGSSMLAPPPTVNVVDRLKPYATPWRPRDYMPAFAFIPRYLEVNQNICSAVYLRHPVVKPGLAEVPTPFHPQTGQLAFNYYLRRR